MLICHLYVFGAIYCVVLLVFFLSILDILEFFILSSNSAFSDIKLTMIFLFYDLLFILLPSVT